MTRSDLNPVGTLGRILWSHRADRPATLAVSSPLVDDLVAHLLSCGKNLHGEDDFALQTCISELAETKRSDQGGVVTVPFGLAQQVCRLSNIAERNSVG